MAVAMDAPQRRLVFGFNVILQVVLVAAIVIALIWAIGLVNIQGDWTSTGRNSLSSRTVRLLENLDQNVRITAVFAEPDKRDELGQKRRRRLDDLLRLYDQAGGARVSTYMLDPSLQKAETDELLARLQELPAYRDEAQPHKDALARFAELNQQISALIMSEYNAADDLVQADPQLAQDRNFNIIRNNFEQLARESQRIAEEIEEISGGEIPKYGEALEAARQYLESVQVALQGGSEWMTGETSANADLSAQAQAFFAESAERYQPVLTAVQQLLEDTAELEDVEIEEVYAELTRWRTGPPVLVETEQEAHVIPFWELWTRPADPNAPVGPEGEDRVFAGEQAISSAVLRLTQEQKTAVIFTRFGGQPLLTPDMSQFNPMMRQMPRAPFQELKGVLEDANFLTAEWNLAEQKTPPKVEDAARFVYVVFPPTPPPQQNPMQPSRQPTMTAEDRQLVLDAVGASGMGIFLVGWQPPPSPMPGAVADYEYADYLRSTWGVDVNFSHLTLEFAPHPEKDGQWIPASREPRMLTTPRAVELTDFEIVEPSQTDQAGFFGVAPLSLLDGELAPEGVTLHVLARVPETRDIWAVSDLTYLQQQFRRNEGVRPQDGDIRAPFPVAVAATNAEEQRLVVFGSEDFLNDSIAQATGLRQAGNRLVLGALYPANTDIFINTLHWLAGEVDRIAIGPKSAEVPRLTELDDEWSRRLPWLLVGIWPGLALLVGVVMWMVRRR